MNEINLLLVDYDPEIQNLVRDILGYNKNIDYHEAENAEQAVEIFNKVHPEIIITDVATPDKSGLRFLTQIENALSETICIIISGYLEEYPDVMRRKNIRYVQKPITNRRLSEIVNTAVDIIQLKRKLSQLTEHTR